MVILVTIFKKKSNFGSIKTSIIIINEKTEYSNTIIIVDGRMCFCLSKYDCRTLHG